MEQIKGTGEELPWEKNAREEAQRLGQVMFENFKHAMNLCISLVPPDLQVKPEIRAKAFEIVVEAWIAGAINPIATFANTTKAIEDEVIKAIRMKFEWIREHEKDLQIERLDKIAEERKTSSGLVLAPGAKA